MSNAKKENYAYWAELQEELKIGGLAAIMHDLKTEDISEFNPRRLPSTSAGLDMKLMSATSVERWFFELLSLQYRFERDERGIARSFEAQVEGQYVDKQAVYDSYRRFCADTDHMRPEPESAFWKKMRKILPGLRERRINDADSKRVREAYFPSLSAARQTLERYFRQPID